MLIGVVVVEVGDGGEDGEALARGVELSGALADGFAQDGVAVAQLKLELADLERVFTRARSSPWSTGLVDEVADACRQGPAADLGRGVGGEGQDGKAVRALGEVPDRVKGKMRGAGGVEIEQHQIGALSDAQLQGATPGREW